MIACIHAAARPAPPASARGPRTVRILLRHGVRGEIGLCPQNTAGTFHDIGVTPSSGVGIGQAPWEPGFSKAAGQFAQDNYVPPEFPIRCPDLYRRQPE